MMQQDLFGVALAPLPPTPPPAQGRAAKPARIEITATSDETPIEPPRNGSWRVTTVSQALSWLGRRGWRPRHGGGYERSGPGFACFRSLPDGSHEIVVEHIP